MSATRQSIRMTVAYQERVRVLGEIVQADVEQVVNARLDDLDLSGSFEAAVDSAALIVAAGQARAADIALGYFRSLSQLELGEPLEIVEPLRSNVGQTGDGRSIVEAMVASRARMLEAIGVGKAVEEAMKIAAIEVARIGRYEVPDAASRELANQGRTVEPVTGWRSVARGTCGACLARDDGAVKSLDGVMPPYHPSCNCVPELNFDVPDRVQRPSGRDRFESLDPPGQDGLLGADRARLLRAGLIAWGDLVQINRFEEWTPVVTERPLIDLLVIAGITKEDLATLN